MAPRVSHSDMQMLLRQGDFTSLFIDRLGWNNPDLPVPIRVRIKAGKAANDPAHEDVFAFDLVADKHTVSIFQCAVGRSMITREQRRKLERELAKHAHEHTLIFHTDDFRHQIWQVPYRDPGKPIRLREYEFVAGQASNALHDFVNKLYFSLREEAKLTLLDVTSRFASGVVAEKVTKKFYDEFSKQRVAFVGFIDGITNEGDRNWYAAIMLDRLMFSWFLQSKGFHDGDDQYLPKRLAQARQGKLPVENFHSFYQTFLKALFHEGFNAPVSERSPEMRRMLGNIPYINGGIFEQHRLERQNPGIAIPDEAFERLFKLFGSYTWHLDDRPIAKENEINPDVLGHIFEKFVNQKEKGAYYTKEDVTGYISQNTIIPWLLDRAKEACAIAFDHTVPGSVWELLRDTPDRYIYGSMKHGVIDEQGEIIPIAPEIAAGEHDISQRGNWNERATEPYYLPTETWREYAHRRRRMIELRGTLARGDIHEIDDLITWNLDIRQFAEDIVEFCGGVDLVKALWRATQRITVLDPTVGSGAFLFAAVRVLEPIMSGLLDRMDDLVQSSTGYHPNSSLAEFDRTLEERNAHPNQNYYVMRQIILNNLYGVDIEEEAVEICKLRLFLLLAAQLEPGEKIEPLPDIDFNIRPGNTLVGYASREEVAKATSTGQMSLNFDGSVSRIEEQAKLADQAFQHFKQVQMADVAARNDLRQAKQGYREKITALRDELDRYLYKQQGATDSFASWKARTLPFHWFAEFHHVVVGRGGFDVIIGNPPYVRAADIRKQYDVRGFRTDSCPNIYAVMCERAAELTDTSGKLGIIVPLSLSFSNDFSSLREVLGEKGRAWYSSFDILPASLFTGAAVRCTILIVSQNPKPKASVTRLMRWRSINRPALMQLLEYTVFNRARGQELPRLASEDAARVLAITTSQSKSRQERYVAGSHYGAAQVRWAKASLNFLSVYLADPPSLDEVTLEDCPSNAGVLTVQSRDAALASLAVLAGEIYMWYWWTRGDGINVPSWVISDYLLSINGVSKEHLQQLTKLGEMLWDRRNEALVFKHHAKRFIGNYNYRPFNRITRRADLILLDGIGCSLEEAIGLLDLVQRTLLVNELAGEKGIPDALVKMFPRERERGAAAEQPQTLTRVDQFIRDRTGLSCSELECVLTTGYPQWPTVAD